MSKESSPEMASLARAIWRMEDVATLEEAKALLKKAKSLAGSVMAQYEEDETP